MPVGGRRRVGRPRKRGRGLRETFNKVNDFLKRTKLISKAGKMGAAFGIPYAGEIGAVAGQLGYGRRRRVTRRRRR